MSSKAVTRKRSRAQLQEQDELATEQPIAPLSSTKKRKLNADGLSPLKGGTLGSIKQSIGSLLGFKRTEKENVPQDCEQDELAEENSKNDAVDDKPAKDIWDVEDSDSEEANGKRRVSGRKNVDATPIGTKSTKKGSASSRRDNRVSSSMAEDMWEVPESPPRPSRSISKAERAKALLAPPVRRASPEPVRRTPGRPRKSDILKNAKKLSNQAIREKMMSAPAVQSDEEEDDNATTPIKRRRRQGHFEEDVEAESTPKSGKASTARKRGRPAQVKAVEENQAPKSILTPVKQRTGRGRKSVVFDGGNEVDLGFRDLPSSAATSKSNRVKKSLQSPSENFVSKSKIRATELTIDSEDSQEEEGAEDEEEEEQSGENVEMGDIEEVMCGVCSGLESRERNPILLCDGEGCGFAVHKKCYSVAKIPEGDWFCSDCEAAAKDLQFQQLEAVVSVAGISNVPDIEGFENHLKCMQRIILDKLTGRRRTRLQGHEEEMQKVHQVVEQTVLAGEGNSMLVIGARGCGKTTLVESVILDLSKEHRDNFHVVRLNGFIHTDDKLALKETWRQLGREMELEDDIAGKTSNYSDTLASLLALLSHPSEISSTEPEQTAKSVIFILDEFDLFTTHPRQTLLYNLFDIAQARKAPIVVLGLTTRVDVVESLEKRVKSRFSHRYVHLSLPRSIPAFWDICKGGLVVDADELDDESLGFSGPGQDEFVSFWQSTIEDLYNKDSIFKRHVQSEFYRSKSVPTFFTSCILPIANLAPRNLPLTGKLFTNALFAPDSKLHILQGLSELELALLIAAARLDIILDTDTCNFAMAYDEYSNLTSRYKLQTSSSGVTALGASAKVWGRDVALGAWERLAEYELLVPAGIGGGGRDFGTGGRMWKIDIGLEEITGSVDSLSGVMAKWCREI